MAARTSKSNVIPGAMQHKAVHRRPGIALDKKRKTPAATPGFCLAASHACLWTLIPERGYLTAVTRSLLVCLCLSLCGWSAIAEADPAAAISAYREQHGEGRVVADATLTRIAREQASAMAAKDRLDHDVLGRFSSRIAPAGAGRAAENIAYGYDSFAKTLDQWINSAGHRRNLLLSRASRVGVASARSSASGRTYWAMVIAGGYERRTKSRAGPDAGPPNRKSMPRTAAKQSCRLKILTLCL